MNMTRQLTGSDINDFFSGKRLFGNDFSEEEIEAWFKDEQEGYAELGAKRKSEYRYVYHALNNHYGFRYVKDRKFSSALGIGSAYGDEFLPVASQFDALTILEPSTAFNDATKIAGTSINYVRPQASGILPFDNSRFDLVTCFGVLHHIPNVSTVIGEIARCMQSQGLFLLREPVVSMGDWRIPRRGLTKRERGIPQQLLIQFLREAGLDVRHAARFGFPLFTQLCVRLGVAPYASPLLTRVDGILSNLFLWNMRYHRTRLVHRFAPTSIYIVAQKQ
jgi:SAM-dependent methyltransferase